jgi:hypothetical protein
MINEYKNIYLIPDIDTSGMEEVEEAVLFYKDNVCFKYVNNDGAYEIGQLTVPFNAPQQEFIFQTEPYLRLSDIKSAIKSKITTWLVDNDNFNGVHISSIDNDNDIPFYFLHGDEHSEVTKFILWKDLSFNREILRHRSIFNYEDINDIRDHLEELM